jgi:hypothetical protein
MRLRRKIVFLAALVLVTAVAALAALRAQSQHNQPPKRQHADELAASDEVPTLVQEGVMSARQRQHSKLYRGSHYPSGGRIPELLEKQRQGDLIVWGSISEVPRMTMTLGRSLGILICEADAVVVGVVKSKSSNLSETGTFVFTDYEVAVEQVLKNDEQSPIEGGGGITVTRPGGAISLRGRVVRAISREVERLKVGQRYLLYMKAVPGTGTYGQIGRPMFDDAFLLRGNEVEQISDKPLPLGWKRTADAASYLAEARQALNSPCAPGAGHE